MTMTSIWIMGLLFGIKRSLEPDHVIANNVRIPGTKSLIN